MLFAQFTLSSGSFSHVELNRIHRLCPQSTKNTDFPATFICENEDGTEGFSMDYQIILIQAIGTLVLCFVLNYVNGKYSTSQDHAMRGLSYAATFMLLIYTARRQGWCYNPSIAGAIGLFELKNLPNTNGELTRYLYAYAVGPIVGSLLSALVYKCYAAELSDDEEEVKDDAAKDASKDAAKDGAKDGAKEGEAKDVTAADKEAGDKEAGKKEADDKKKASADTGKAADAKK